MPHLAEAYYAGADTPAATVALPPVAPAAPDDDDDHLPAGWTMHFDPSSGSLYYHLASTGTSATGAAPTMPCHGWLRLMSHASSLTSCMVWRVWCVVVCAGESRWERPHDAVAVATAVPMG